MNLVQLTDSKIPPLKTSDSVAHAKRWMQAAGLQSLPVLKGKRYIGIIHNEQLQKENETLPLSATQIIFDRQFIYSNQHLYNALGYAIQHRIEILPVINNDGDYEGLITRDNLMGAYASVRSMNNDGSIIELEISSHDFLLSKLVDIVASNNGHIQSMDVNDKRDNTPVTVTLKLSNEDISRIEQAFYRIGYHVTATHHSVDSGNNMQDRYDALMRYLNV
ncbi:MAG: hypothetical protein IPO27_16750 [Bacteroidetes bacterium]|nr:hypothetical protein [Bacteroidota bacterium]